jgi:hypothetical protein
MASAHRPPIRGQHAPFEPGNTFGFQKGVSGNPTGRPVKWRTLITQVLKEKLSRMQGSGENRKTFAEALADRLVACGLHPKPEEDKTVIAAITEIINYTEGKPKQQIDVNDITESVAARSDADLEFYIRHGHWPEEKVTTQ